MSCASCLLSPVVLLALSVGLQAQTPAVFFENFESGLGPWTTLPGGVPGSNEFLPWHVAPDGECGAVTAMAVYNHGPASCDYLPGPPLFVNLGRLVSPPIALPAAPGFTVEFDYRLQTSSNTLIQARVCRASDPGDYDEFDAALVQSAQVAHATLMLPDGVHWAGESVRLEFWVVGPWTGTGFGWMVDNVRITPSAFQQYGSAKLGSNGFPKLMGTGLLAPGSANTLALSRARPSSPATLVGGSSLLNAPFKGGTMVPMPQALLFLTTNPAGELHLPLTWPSGVPAGLEIFLQYWISDPGALSGLAASNALKGTSG